MVCYVLFFNLSLEIQASEAVKGSFISTRKLVIFEDGQTACYLTDLSGGQKFSFDFYNPMVVQKCIATTQALLNDRDVVPRQQILLDSR